MMLIIRLIMNRKIRIVMKAADVHKPATTPHIINTQITDTIKNKFQLRSSDCLVDLVL